MSNNTATKPCKWPDVEEINHENKHLFDQETRQLFELIDSTPFEELFPNKHRVIEADRKAEKEYIMNYAFKLIEKNSEISYKEIVLDFLQSYGGSFTPDVIFEKAKVLEEAYEIAKKK